jgi:hypothetical protein
MRRIIESLPTMHEEGYVRPKYEPLGAINCGTRCQLRVDDANVLNLVLESVDGAGHDVKLAETSELILRTDISK